LIPIELKESSEPPCQVEGQITKSRPVKHFCKLCNTIQNFRTKHCKLCKCCIARFDHHCYYTGCCIGEKNHRIYWTMLLLLVVQSYINMGYLWGCFDHHDVNHGFMATSTLVFCFIICLLLFLWTILLWGFHCYLLLTNQTTWESTKEKTIDYLSAYPYRYKPFDRGVVQNSILCCFPPKEPINWELPDVEEAWKNPKPVTLLNNECMNKLC